MRRVVLLAPFFPPSASVASKRPLRFVRHLRAHGWEPIVLTVEGSAGGGTDRALERTLPPGVWIDRGYAGPLWRAWRAWEDWKARARGRGERARQLRPAGKRLLDAVGQLTYELAPLDHYLPYAAGAALRAARLARDTGAAAIYATSYPTSTLLAATAAAARAGVPALLDLRDPWTLDPLVFPRKPTPVRALEARLERACFARAARILVNTDATRRAYAAVYPALADRLHTLPNGFDRGLFGAAAPVTHAGFALVHFGNLYGERTVAPVLEALAGLDPAVRLVNYGEVAAADLARARTLGVGDRLEARPTVPYADTLTVLGGAGALLLLQSARTQLQIPGKLYDYLCAGRPILAITGNPEIAELVARTGAGLSAPPERPDLIRAALERLRRGDGFAPDPARIESYSADAQAAELAAHFDDVTDGRRST